MHPFEQPSGGLPPGVSPHVDLRLQAGWSYDHRKGAFVSKEGDRVSVGGLLPAGTRIVPTAASLAAADPKSLSEDELLLARCLQVVPPSAANLAEVANVLRRLEGAEQVSISPTIGLP